MPSPTFPDVNDLSEFPSLSNAPQPQYQNPGQAVWASANQRATQHTPIQRQQQAQANAQGPIQPQQPHQIQEQAQSSLDDAFFPLSQHSGTLDDYRHGIPGGIGQLSGPNQQQASNVDEFPPLGPNGHGEIGQDRSMHRTRLSDLEEEYGSDIRGSLMQNSAGGNYTNAFASGKTEKTTGPLFLARN